jgi:hypothetical protein
MWEVLAAVVALIGVIFGAYIGTRRRIRAELEGQYDADLRKLRLQAYPKLWATTEPFALYGREPGWTYPDRDALQKLSRALRRWYFQTGGLYLSAEARDAYFQLQESLEAIASSKRWQPDDSVPGQIDAADFEALREMSSWLRTAVTYDVGTRRRFSLAPAWAAEDAEVNRRAIDADREAKQQAARSAADIARRWSAEIVAGDQPLRPSRQATSSRSTARS